MKPFLIGMLLAIVLCREAFCQADNEKDREFGLRQDTPWLVFIDTQVMDGYLSYKDSPFSSPTRIRVSYWLRTNADDSDNDPEHPYDIKYEDLWFKDGKAIGLHRYCTVMPLRFDGEIFVRRSPCVTECSQAIADTIMRLLLDVTLINPPVRGFCVPVEIYNQVEEYLPAYNFQRVHRITGSTKLLLHLIADPPTPGCDKYYSFNYSR